MTVLQSQVLDRPTQCFSDRTGVLGSVNGSNDGKFFTSNAEDEITRTPKRILEHPGNLLQTISPC